MRRDSSSSTMMWSTRKVSSGTSGSQSGHIMGGSSGGTTTSPKIHTFGGSSEISSTDTTHSYSDDEKMAFVNWINDVLGRDLDLKQVLPISYEGNGLFTALEDGILLCKLINQAVNDTIDERVINKKPHHPVQKHENHTLMLNSARAIGCNIVNIGASDIIDGIPHLCLGLIWQIIKIGLFSQINLKTVPGLARLCEEHETVEQLMALPTDVLLLRWVNYHLKNAGCSRRIQNFGGDIRDSEAYTYLLREIAPKGVPMTLDALRVTDMLRRAETVLDGADRLDCRKFVTAQDIVKGNQRLNLAFVANLFNNYPALKPVEKPIELIEETREEKTYRNWMNSLGVQPYVTSLYQDLRDGYVLLQLIDKTDVDLVNWKRVNRPPYPRLGGTQKQLENCNYVVELGKSPMNLSLVGIGGADLYDGNKTLVLAIVWQLMRAYTLHILNQLALGGRKIQDREIIEWANTILRSANKPSQSMITSFRDAHIASALPILDLVESISQGTVDYTLVIDKPRSGKLKSM